VNVRAHQAEEHMAGEKALFFRATDRLRLEGYVAALTQNGMSLAMVSDHDVILDHYVKMLISRVREVAPQVSLEVYFPANADALIARFNERLKEHSIEDAMSDSAQSAAPKIWVLHDASALPDHEIQLLARLVQNFPGANIRVIMLMTQASQKAQLLSTFGRRILNWDIETPNAEQRSAMLEQARAQGREISIGELLKQLAPPPGVSIGASTTDQAGEITQTVPVQNFEKTSPSQPKAKPGQQKAKQWFAACILLLAACGLAVGFWYKDAIIPLMATTKPAAPAPSVQSPAADVTVTAPPAERVGKDNEEIIHTTAQIQAGHSWILAMPAVNFVVLHSTASSYQEIKFWLQNQPQLKLAQIVAHTLPNQTGLQFSAVSAPFTTSTEARDFADGAGMPKGAVVYSGQFLREQFPPEPKSMTAPQTEKSR
jgi:hypothetical protein